ncbi:hypothetical protein C8R44DRAFT_756817, partial [Mycena epipterygia]
MAVSLLRASPEVLRAIVLYAATPFGPPREWLALVLCCHTFRRQLDTPAMHTLLFETKFHVPADVHHLLPSHAKVEMKRRFSALKFFQRGHRCLDDQASFTDALWVAYVMLRAEEPRQKNVDQLLWAGLPDLLGWPLCNETNSLVLALMWLVIPLIVASVRAETSATRDEVMERIRPYVLAAFRYPLSSVQEWCFSSNSTIVCAKTVQNTNPGPPPSSREVMYFGLRTVQFPSAPIYSILCYFARLDTLVPMFPVHLSSAEPALSRAGPRRQDVEYFINECRTRFEAWDFVMERTPPVERGAIGQAYFPGSLTGRWQGSSIVPCVNEYHHWLHDLEAPKTMETFCRQPLYITLREHFSYVNASGPEKFGRAKDIDDAWLPSSWAERDGGIEVSFGESNNCTKIYETGTGNLIAENVADVIVTGQTDDPYATAWGGFKVFGRVRLSDGLVVLKRESVAGLGTTLLRGYMSSSHNFAGRYRAIDKEGEAAEWEAAFSLCRM